jgi:hypothetical protein
MILDFFVNTYGNENPIENQKNMWFLSNKMFLTKDNLSIYYIIKTQDN